ncbi:PREDICTED: testis-specific H1 histone-like [Chrysochloris asiatica]|uniref:Testis-specific H1 histone-like n=1 Tax=Chrysochloris asiatica TaxID=185453 RepID=A0A9B0TIA9_CHRAS|nr:PREDICTED: testis-specific H1 histone-like [Chrysochloris asiatica]
MAEAVELAEPNGESFRAQVKTQAPLGKVLKAPARRGPRSVLKVSQLLLRAIDAHQGLTLATLKKELANAGYEVRRKISRRSGETARPEVKGTLLRVSGSDAEGYYRVCKIPKPKRKPVRRKVEEGARSPKRPPPRPRSPRRRRTRRKAAKKARAVWRRDAKMALKMKRLRSKAKDQVLPRSKKEARLKVMEKGRSRSKKEEKKPKTKEDQRPSSKQREEKKQDCEKLVKRTNQKPSPAQTNRTSSGPAKSQEVKAARTKSSTKSDRLKTAAGNP